MKSLSLVGVVLVIIGVIGLMVGHINFTTREKVLDVGPIHATADKEHHVAIPDIAAIVAVIAGLGLVLAGRRGAA